MLKWDPCSGVHVVGAPGGRCNGSRRPSCVLYQRGSESAPNDILYIGYFVWECIIVLLVCVVLRVHAMHGKASLQKASALLCASTTQQ